MFETEDLARTYIRAQDAEGKWDSLSLGELLRLGRFRAVAEWFSERLASFTGLDRAGVLDGTDRIAQVDVAVNMCRVVEALSGPLAKAEDKK